MGRFVNRPYGHNSNSFVGAGVLDRPRSVLIYWGRRDADPYKITQSECKIPKAARALVSAPRAQSAIGWRNLSMHAKRVGSPCPTTHATNFVKTENEKTPLKKQKTKTFWKKGLTFRAGCGKVNVVPEIWGYSSAGRALEWHSRGQRFDPAYLHQKIRPR